MKRILDLKPLSFYLNYNEHRDYYESIEECHEKDKEGFVDWDECVKTNTVFELHVYPRTPISFYRVYASTLEKAIAKMVSILTSQEDV